MAVAVAPGHPESLAEKSFMVGLASALSLCLGVALAAHAPSAGLRAEAFETSGGVFLVSGLVLLGSGLPVFH
ncbi:hypothetical protein [Methylobacterium sp. J-067]|uniref:hypothetical protein n=1 Tax=Methylobacterium sp. J-067 TaxID=2836648 RepID=UPI001FBA5786|nr:hypothetical protein [Methylobacterium sp. J-067]MCJ2024946.1 hypothetical protein [Methylobacterium sp. J-067]